MTFFLRCVLCCVAFVTLGSLTHGQEEVAELTAKQVEEVRELIGGLDADSFAEREEAMRRLRLIGPAVIPMLEEASEKGTPEVRFRAATLLKAIRVDPLESFCALPDVSLSVEHGMWLIARILNPKVKKEDLSRQLDDLAAKVREKLGKDVSPAKSDPQVVVAAIRAVLFEDFKFTGNKEDYNNPENSSLERILATRKGLPITLSHLTIAVARRLEVPIVGVPASGYYLVKYEGTRAPAGFAKNDIYFHPYEGGRVLSREDRLKSYPSHDPDVMVPPDSSRSVLIRMLSNLSSALDHDASRAEQLNQVVAMRELLQKHRPKLDVPEP